METNGVAPELGDGVTPLEALAQLARSAREDPVPVVLATVAETVRTIAGFAAVVVNIYRPAWDDYEVVLVIGSEESRRDLEGTTVPSEVWQRLFDGYEQRVPGVFFLTEEAAFWDDLDHVHTPDIPDSDDPFAWCANDGLLVHLADASGAPLGFLSMDEPVSGRRPEDGELRLLRAICSHAEQALESARQNEWTAAHQLMLSQLLGASPALSASATEDALLAEVCDAIVPNLGFERAAAYHLGPTGALQLSVSRGWDSRTLLSESVTLPLVESLLTGEREHAGCWLVSAEDLFGARAGGDKRSRRNGRGPAAWRNCCLLAPFRDGGGAISGLVVIEDPLDRLLPSNDRRRAVRLLIDHASAAQNSIEHRRQLRHLATHDPLTGVRNRRGLSGLLTEYSDVALLVCDLDHFKQVNDRYGHDVGDRVLALFGDLLRELTRDGDVAIRLGGEEFCIVLPHTDRAAAVATAERLRTETSRRMRDVVVDGVTVSVGVAATSAGYLDARGLLAAADSGLYAAKDAGRNRSFDASDGRPREYSGGAPGADVRRVTR
jgi:diguanylate cyclase (GGDEF)-like protein